MGALDEILTYYNALPADKQAALLREVEAHSKPWTPNPGPQTQAYLSQADILLYGGQAGGGKTHLAIGWGVNEAESGIIFRRALNQTDGLEKEGKAIIGSAASFNGQDLEWTWPGGKSLKLGGMKEASSWQDHAGRERDYYCFDEGGEFLELQVASIIAWLRAPPGKRCRIIIASNPPRTSEGFWLIKWFAPWLDESHPAYPAAPGQLFWAIGISRDDGSYDTIWVDGPGEYDIDGETYTAKSRTFIPASLEDNPYRNTSEYRATLQSLPEPLRSQLLYGDWKAGLKDNANQVIPSDWVRRAMKRTDKPEPHIPMCAIGVDCSGGGDDPLVLAPRYDGHYMPLIEVAGSSIPMDAIGSHTAGVIVTHRRDNAMVVLDMGGGYGGATLEHLKNNSIDVAFYKGAEKTDRRTKDGRLRFTNTRSAAYWLFREALDPGQPGGSPIALPDDPKLLADLTAPTFEVVSNGIKITPKEDIVEMLGRSPDRGDAVVMAWWAGPKQTTHALDWAEQKVRRRKPQVITRRPRG